MTSWQNRMTCWYHMCIFSKTENTKRWGVQPSMTIHFWQTTFLQHGCHKTIFVGNDHTWRFVRQIFWKGSGDDDDGHDGRISPEHPSPIPHAPRDNMSRKGKSLTPIWGIFLEINFHNSHVEVTSYDRNELICSRQKRNSDSVNITLGVPRVHVSSSLGKCMFV